MVEAINKLYHNIGSDEFKEALEKVTPEAWERWLKNKDEYYKKCKRHISLAVRHYAMTTPIPPKDIEGQANLIFCITCLRWDPNGKASLPTYVSSQLDRLGPYLVRLEAKHKNNITQVSAETNKKDPNDSKKGVLEIIGEMDPDNTLMSYMEKASADVKELYLKLHEGWYERKSKGGNSRPITAVGLYRSKVFAWDLRRCMNALTGLTQVLDAWRYGLPFYGCALLSA